VIDDALKLNSGASYTFSCVPNSKPKNGIIMVMDTKEKITVRILKTMLNTA
jgi:hypothetical protein